jgi:predicted transcriptional regulator
MEETKIRRKISSLLMRRKDVLFTSKQLSKELGVSYQTVLKYLAILEAKGVIECKKAGPAKVWFLRKRQRLFSL